jgi:enoyl-CoA hydratase/carnithine racemase
MSESRDSDLVERQQDGTVLTLTLRRESAGNALDAALVEAVQAALPRQASPDLHLIVLRGAGRGFCSGFDLSGLESQSDGDLLLRFVRIEMLLQAVRHAPVPTLALAHGHALGAGADLFAACTWRVAAPGTRFAFPGARFGLVLGTRRLTTLVGPQAALDMTLRGQRVDAEAALACGLATTVAPPEEWSDIVARMAADVATTAEAQGLLRRAALHEGARDSDLADLVRSAALPGLGARIRAYADAARAARHDGGRLVRR